MILGTKEGNLLEEEEVRSVEHQEELERAEAVRVAEMEAVVLRQGQAELVGLVRALVRSLPLPQQL
jgi:hypothetical protein